MYTSYFGFSTLPFENNIDQLFFFFGEDHYEILSSLYYFIKTNKSFAMVSGDVGTGKTMLINAFLKRLVPKSIKTIIISNPYLDSHEILLYIARVMNIAIDDKQHILGITDKVKATLMDTNSLHRQLLLIVDEAHLLSDQILEEIRLLSNIEKDDKKLIQILLIGQYELSHKLDRPEMRQLRQRININRFLSPLNAGETVNYIDHRLKRVGSSFDSCFTSNCGSVMYKITGGVPRQINNICDNALLICVTEGRRKVSRKTLRKAEEALRTDLILTPQRLSGKRNRLKSLIPIMVSLAFLMGVIFIFLRLGIIKTFSIIPSATSYLEKSEPVESAKASPKVEMTIFWANPGGKAYHYPSCKWVKHAPANNLRKFSSADEALKAGYLPCRRCNPPPN
jgi:general secretion pathway protein A